MLFAAHAIVGGVAGSKLDTPLGAFFVGVLSHFLLDSIPHFDTTDKGRFTLRQWALIGADFLLGLALILFVIKPVNHTFYYGLFGGIFPDLLDVSPFWRNWFQKTWFGKYFHHVHLVIQRYYLPPLPGLAIQWLVIALAVWYFKI